MRFSAVLIAFPLYLIFLTACTGPNSPNPDQIRPVLPTKDEVALVNGEPLTLQDYLEIRQTSPQLTPEQAVWAGTATLAIIAEAKSRGILLNKIQGLEISEYALEKLPKQNAAKSLYQYYRHSALGITPTEVRKEMDHLLSRSVVIKSATQLSKIH